MSRANLIGQRFNRLYVKEYAYVKNKKVYWKCICDCGNIKILPTAYVTSGDTTSCGCYRKQRTSLYCKTHNQSFRCHRYTNLTKQQQEILDGLIISDGNLHIHKNGYNARFTQACILKEYIQYIKNILPLKWTPIRTKKGGQSLLFNKTIISKDIYYLQSCTDQYLTEQYYRWYKNGKKIIPKDLKITSLMLKNWFWGDGFTCFNNHKNRPHLYNTEINLGLCTDSFTYNECIFLQQQLKINTNINVRINQHNTKQYRLQIFSQGEVQKFYDYIGLCDLNCFQYKWKIPVSKSLIKEI